MNQIFLSFRKHLPFPEKDGLGDFQVRFQLKTDDGRSTAFRRQEADSSCVGDEVGGHIQAAALHQNVGVDAGISKIAVDDRSHKSVLVHGDEHLILKQG